MTLARIRQIATVLVIDDDEIRYKVYKAFFEKLNGQPNCAYEIRPEISRTPDEAIRSLAAREPCFVVLDLRLNREWGEQSLNIYRAIRHLKCPICLLSANFNDTVALKSANAVLVELRGIPKLGILPYESWIRGHCFDENDHSLPDVVPPDQVSVWNLMLAEAQGHGASWQPRVAGEITFLHLTDTHFSQETSPDLLNVAGMASGASGNTTNLADPLFSDYLLWTGDITDQGLPSEFDKAKQFVTDLKRLKILQPSCPVAMVPGNHDLCWPLALASRMSWEIVPNSPSAQVSEPLQKPAKHWVIREASVPTLTELWRFGAQPFRDFHAELTGESLTLLKDEDRPSTGERSHQFSEVGYRFVAQWARLGFAIFELPIETHVVRSGTSGPAPAPLVSPESFGALTEHAISAFLKSELDPSVCIIVLIHGRDPNQPESGAKRWSRLVAEIARRGHPVIVTGGHEHMTKHTADKRILTIIGVPHDEAHTEGSLTLPGVGYIRLVGLGTKSLGCEITKVQKGNSDSGVPEWQRLSPARFELGNALPHNWVGVNEFSC